MTTDKTGKTETKPPGSDIVPPARPNSSPSLTVDVAYYQSFLDDADMPEAKKHELIETLWSIIISFVDLGFGIHPLQQARGDGQVDADLQILITQMHQEEAQTTNREKTQKRSEP